MKRSNRLRRVKRVLQDGRNRIIDAGRSGMRKFMAGEDRQVLGAGLEEGDLSELHRNEYMSLRRFHRHRDVMAGIDEALSKIEDGSYGICEGCGSEIPKDRLKVMPHAVMCVECQQEIEMTRGGRN